MKLKHKKNNVPMVVRIGPVGEIREETEMAVVRTRSIRGKKRRIQRQLKVLLDKKVKLTKIVSQSTSL